MGFAQKVIDWFEADRSGTFKISTGSCYFVRFRVISWIVTYDSQHTIHEITLSYTKEHEIRVLVQSWRDNENFKVGIEDRSQLRQRHAYFIAAEFPKQWN